LDLTPFPRLLVIIALILAAGSLPAAAIGPPVPPSEHPYKYRLAYVVNGKRIVGYDNERGKGDHRHRGKRDSPYAFLSPQQLIADFMDDVKGSVK